MKLPFGLGNKTKPKIDNISFVDFRNAVGHNLLAPQVHQFILTSLVILVSASLAYGFQTPPAGSGSTTIVTKLMSNLWKQYDDISLYAMGIGLAFGAVSFFAKNEAKKSQFMWAGLGAFAFGFIPELVDFIYWLGGKTATNHLS